MSEYRTQGTPVGTGMPRRPGAITGTNPEPGYAYADPVAQRRIEQLEAERDELRAAYGRDGVDGHACIRVEAYEAMRKERDELRAKVAQYESAQPSRMNEPPVGSWVKDRYGAASRRQPEGWALPGMMPFGRWDAMWDARGPYVLCGPYGEPLEPPLAPPEPSSLPSAPGTPNDATGGAE